MCSDKLIFALYDFLVVCGQEKVPASIVHVILDGLATNRDEKSQISQKLVEINKTVFEMERN